MLVGTTAGPHRRAARVWLRSVRALSAMTILLSAAPAAAQSLALLDRPVLRVEGGVAAMLSSFQRDTLHYDFGVQGSLHAGLSIVDAFEIHLAYSTWYFPSTAGDGQNTLLGGGVRFEPRIGSLGRPFAELDLGLGLTGFALPNGPDSRWIFDAAIGFEFRVLPWFAVGPVLRYAQLFTQPGDQRFDPQSLSLGVSASLHVPRAAPPPPPPPPPDTDHDGVIDRDDECPTEPMGEHPDPAHRGCPVHDRDGDGVPDEVDRCPSAPAGEHPDPDHPGCPDGDADDDGVLDHQDACPTTPAGEHPDASRPGCPDHDTDGDGVFDHDDQCPTVPAGLHPDTSRPGCPLADRDHDAVPDNVDACPDRPGAPNPNPRRNGCPGLVVIEGDHIRILQPVFFANNRDRVLPRSFPLLRAMSDALRAQPEIRRVSVDGHTDNIGTDEHNLDLSQRRANSVVAWLLAHGVDTGRLEAHGYGPTRPIVPNTTARGRAANRRVEFVIVDPAAPGSHASSGAPSEAPPAAPTAIGSGAPSSAPPASRSAPTAPTPRRRPTHTHRGP